MKHIRYALEAILLYILFFIFKILGVRRASNFGSWLGRSIGPKLAASRKAMRNIERAFPDFDETQKQKTLIDMWDNLGRVVAEYPHLKTLAQKYTDVKGADIIERYRADNQPFILFGGHIGNWELGACFVPELYGHELDITYRAPNNPFVDGLLMKCRQINERIGMHAKSRTAGKAIIGALKDKRSVGVLIDQKYNEGVAVPFFGEPAMTNPIFVQLAQKYKCPFIPARCERLENGRFEIELYEPIALFDENDNPRAVEEVLSDAHTHMERWIKQAPAQWLWLHRRWNS